MRRLVCTFVVHNPKRQVFASRSKKPTLFNTFYFHGFKIFLYYLLCLFSGEVEMVHISIVDVRGCVLEVKVYTLHTCMTYTR